MGIGPVPAVSFEDAARSVQRTADLLTGARFRCEYCDAETQIVGTCKNCGAEITDRNRVRHLYVPITEEKDDWPPTWFVLCAGVLAIGLLIACLMGWVR
jgi:hypothetical protein